MAKKTALCFVCTGNTCRSPIAQFILKNKVISNPDMDLRITSFGINVTETAINPFAKNLLKNHNIKMTKFIPKQITPDKVKGFGAIITMTDLQKANLEKQGYADVYSINQLTGLGDVQDPYQRGQKAYEDCFDHLDKACDIIFKMLKKVLK